jgi:aarF domain-containing kinase
MVGLRHYYYYYVPSRSLSTGEKGATATRPACLACSADQSVTAEGNGRELLLAFRRSLQRLARSTHTLLRALMLLIGWSPLALTGIPIYVLYTLRLAPQMLRDFWWRYALFATVKSGPAFVKALQWLATRKDVMPAAFCERFSALHAATRDFDFASLTEAVEAAFGPHCWQRLRVEPDGGIGCGCVAQVFRGFLRDAADGDGPGLQVAIKTIHPRIRDGILMDLDIMRAMTSVLEMVPRMRWLSLGECVEEFAALMYAQLDLRVEARNLQRFRENFRNDASIGFPNPIEGWVSESCLVETFEEGQLIGDWLQLATVDENGIAGSEGAELAAIGLRTFLRMLFIHNFCHGDLHPGNILVAQGPGGKAKLVFIDTGIVVENSPEERQKLVDLFYYIVRKKGHDAGLLMVDKARANDCADRHAFASEIEDIVNQAVGHDLRLNKVHFAEVSSTAPADPRVWAGLLTGHDEGLTSLSATHSPSQLMGSVLSSCFLHRVKLESRFCSTVISIALLDGVGRRLNPEMNILKEAFPILLQAKAMRSM